MSSNLQITHAVSHVDGLLRERLGRGEVAPHVTKSWQRCVDEFGTAPDAVRDTPVLNAQAVRERQQQFGELLNVARAEMESLYEMIAGSGYAVILSDTESVILGAITDPSLTREFRDAGLRIGAIWSEQYEGTNGLGTCLAEGVPVTVYRDEHFRRFNTGLSCSGAPVLDAQGKVLGVLDASTVNAGDTRLIQRHTMALVNMSANLISRCRFMRECATTWVLRFHSRPEFVGLLHEALLAVGSDGIVRAVNDSAMAQLGMSRAQLVGKSLTSIFPFDFETVERRAATDASLLWPVRDLAYGRRFFARVRTPTAQSTTTSRTPKKEISGVQTTTRQHVVADARMQHNIHCGRHLFGRKVPLLLQGATGTGKEAFAKSLHLASAWAERPFVAVNCAAIPEALIESELFGYTRGAFTDAAREGHLGKIRQSSGGTLFLDEIGDMPLHMQTRLLRVLEEHEVVPLGGEQAVPVDLHIISATHHDLLQMVQNGEFREDLYYRLNGITLQLPTLRERTDKRELIEALLADDDNDEPIPVIHDDAMQRLLDYHWPGNIRQLRNTLRTAAALCSDSMIRVGNLPHEITDGSASQITSHAIKDAAAPLQSAERDALLRELERLHWNISRAASALGVSRNTLYRKMRKHNIALPG
ncbi:sigma-54-dependent Fis family transcriptional regulator [Rhodanobacter sp. A1T4]|uniref:sigma-54-dependent Fis family transcriptional regulator n=1 Tax=Rhodanobacter sp. A1T4 TaxID=2723087 RepID=UPI00161FD1AD|nr:sigma-54-dependent Fis family transcriptional regulator [Rhodanobacter sp. A1T4]MBB6248760.1 transcriptional regulator of acetoin/glycerol metabolism [Rhodanobacter sp. A1T4]